MRGPSRAPVSVLVVAGVLAGALAGCGGSSGDDSGSRTEPTTPRALAAAVLRHVDRAPSAVAPLGSAEGVEGDAVGIEAALPREVGDNAHLGVLVLPDGAEEWREGRCDAGGDFCHEEEVDGGVRLRLTWSPEAPESDPGGVQVTALRPDGSLVGVYFYGPPVPQERPRDLEVTTVAELEDVALDPDVALTTTPDLVAAGDAIDDDVWLDWYGQGNGAPSPAP